MICHCWYFTGISYKYEALACNGCHHLSIAVSDLSDFMILNIKGVDYRCYVFNVSKNDAIKLLDNFCLGNKVVL